MICSVAWEKITYNGRAWRSGCGFARLTTNNQCPALDNEQDLGEATILPIPMLNEAN